VCQNWRNAITNPESSPPWRHFPRGGKNKNFGRTSPQPLRSRKGCSFYKNEAARRAWGEHFAARPLCARP
jgi:hypothetical protein